VPVVSVSTLGIGSLRQRQLDLLNELRALEQGRPGARKLGGPRRWHLVGHSTGGVDAALLVRASPLDPHAEGLAFSGSGWGEWEELVGRIASVTTIAAPHFGTGLADAPLARFVAGRRWPLPLRDLAKAGVDLTRRGDLTSRLEFAFSAAPALKQMPFFLWHLLLMNQLAADLRPSVLSALSSEPLPSSAKGRLFSIATLAPRPATNHSDKLFRDLWRWTEYGSKAALSLPHAATAALDDPELRLDSQRELTLAPVSETDNDGVATTKRQVLGELIGVVVGDHVDVLGRYRRRSLVDGKIIDPGLLTSGAEFGDDQFFELLLRVGERIARVAQS